MACRFIHPVLEAVGEIMEQNSFSPEAIARVEISSFSLLADEHHFILRPPSGTDAQFSVPFTVAALLYDGKLTPDSYQSHTLENPDILELADRVHLEVDDSFENAYPERLGAHVRIMSHEGTTGEARVDDPIGSDTRPLSDEALLDKFYTLASPLLTRDRAHEILSIVEELEHLPTLDPLTELLRPD
jgi:2-methylcitrate dehydratase PrpD